MYKPYSEPSKSIKNPTSPYYEHYLGDRDEQNRRRGNGENCWTGAESIEWHVGGFVRDTMHGPGEYRWRHRGRQGLFFTYEGNLYMNKFHGYGAMSYPDGRVFTGLFKNDVRYGPGVESSADPRANVGLWRGGRLARLAWRPARGVAPAPHTWLGGRPLVEPLRVVLNATFRTIGQVNQALEFLKQHGSDPLTASENWSRLYPRHCTDKASQLCHVDLFDNEYYNGKIYSLKEQDIVLENDEELLNETNENSDPRGPYYTWNNDKVMIDMMKHCFMHERQREHVNIDLAAVLSGPRDQFKPPAMHELDSRTLLMACYLGHVASTVFLVNERGVDPNIADMLGNTALMYATCGDQVDLIHFLVEAGASVDSPNDSCCTALGVALIRFACAKKDVPANAMMLALIPPPTVPVPPEPQTVFEWHIKRDQAAESMNYALGKSPSKLNKANMKLKSLTSVKEQQAPGKKPTETLNPVEETREPVSNENTTNEDKLYRDIIKEYDTKVNSLFETLGQPATYLFELTNMVEEMKEEHQKAIQPEKNLKKNVSRVLKETMKPSKDAMWQNTQKTEDGFQNDVENLNAEVCDQIKRTILQLLNCGANPTLVKCPQPALFVAIIAGCPELIGHLVRCGADVNEVFPQLFHYTPLDIAVAQPMNETTLDMVRALLAAGACADRRLRNPVDTEQTQTELPMPGPTLLHAVLARKVESEYEEDIRNEIVHLLLEYGCDPLKMYQGQSAVEDATTNLELLDIIIRSPKTDLNAAINEANQTILVKMFHMPFFRTLENVQRCQILTNLLLFGADPLMECEYEGAKYPNLFVVAKNILSDLSNRIKPPAASKTKLNIPKGQKTPPPDQSKGKKEPKKDEVSASDDITNMTQAVELMTDCTRIIYIRWLQTQLAKELIRIIDKYKHRHWSMIIKEHKKKKAAGLWLTAQRCLEIWGHLNTTKRKIYKDVNILRNLLCISHFYHQRSVTNSGFNCVTASEKDETDSYVVSILKDSNKSEILPLQRYVKPELFVKADSKFNVCFECFLPLTEDRLPCKSCHFVSFCNVDCLMDSIDKSNGHACNDYLILQYFPEPPTIVDDTLDDDASNTMTKEPLKSPVHNKK